MPVDALVFTPIGDVVEDDARWLVTARRYAAALAVGNVPGVVPIPPDMASYAQQTISLRFETGDLPGLPQRLMDAYRRLRPGDVAVLDIPGKTCSMGTGRMDRDALARALWQAGFDCPLIWAGSAALKAEPDVKTFARFLPSWALGAGPPLPAALDPPSAPPADRMIAMARRGALVPPAERPLRLSVVLPVFNERATCRQVIECVLAKEIPGVEIEICLVESNSTDGTRDDVLAFADHPRVRLALEEKPSGKGHAVRKGFELATGDIVLIQDADLEYDFADYDRLLEPIRADEVGFVLGSRHAAAGDSVWQMRQFTERRYQASLMNFGHVFFTGLFNFVYGQRLRDPFTMYKVFLRNAIHNVRFECNRFDFDFELVSKLIRQGYHPREIPVSYRSRSFKEGKKVSPFTDPPTWLKACIRHRFSPMHVWPGSQRS